MGWRALCVAALCLPVAAAAGEAPDALELCLERSAIRGERVLDLELRTRRGDAESEPTRATLYLRAAEGEGARALLRVSAPDELSGTAVLLVDAQGEPRVSVYLPELGGVKRLKRRHLSGRLLETDFRYADFELMAGAVERDALERLPDTTLAGRPVWVVAASGDARSEIARAVSYVDRESCVPLRTEFRDAAGTVRRVLSTERIGRTGAGFVARELVMRDLRAASETRIAIQPVERNAALPLDLFTTAALAPAGS